MAPVPRPDLVFDVGSFPANATGELSALLRIQFDPELIAAESGGYNTMILDPQGETFAEPL